MSKSSYKIDIVCSGYVQVLLTIPLPDHEDCEVTTEPDPEAGGEP